MERLKRFAQDKKSLEELREYSLVKLNETILERVYQGQSVNDLAETKNFIEKIILEMEKDFLPPKIEDFVNENE